MKKRRLTRLTRAAMGAVSIAISATLLAPTGVLGAASTRHSSSDGLLSASHCEENRKVGTITYASPFGFDASTGIIEVFAASRLGYFADMCLNVQIVANANDTNELVSSGRAQLTNEGSAADTLQAIAGGAHLVGIETAGDTSDYAVVTGTSITSLKELEGKTFGYYATLPVAIREMFTAAGVNMQTIHLIADTNYDPTQVVQGVIQGLQAYQSNQVITLRAAKAPFNEFTPQQFGVAGTYNVMTVNATFLRRHRQAVADFMRADLHALHYCDLHPSTCVDIEGSAARSAGSPFVTAHEDAVWALERKLTSSHTLPGMGLGVQTYAEWQPEATALRTYKVLTTVPRLRSVEDVSLVAGLYRGTTLKWP